MNSDYLSTFRLASNMASLRLFSSMIACLALSAASLRAWANVTCVCLRSFLPTFVVPGSPGFSWPWTEVLALLLSLFQALGVCLYGESSGSVLALSDWLDGSGSSDWGAESLAVFTTPEFSAVSVVGSPVVTPSTKKTWQLSSTITDASEIPWVSDTNRCLAVVLPDLAYRYRYLTAKTSKKHVN